MPAIDLRYASLPHPEAMRTASTLSEFEFAQFDHISTVLRHRRAGWLTARWLVKRILLNRFRDESLCADEISTLSLDDDGNSSRPYVLVGSDVLPVDVSISYTSTGVLVGITGKEGLRLGVDLATNDRRIGKWDPWYTPREQRWVQDLREPAEAAKLWAIKQAYFKAMNGGERFRPRQYEVTCDAYGRYHCHTVARSLAGTTHIAVTPCDDHFAAVAIHGDQRWTTAASHSVIPESELKRLSSQG